MTVPETAAPATPEKRTSRLAIVALVLAIFPVCLNLIGVILGIIAAVRISKRKDTQTGMGLAIAAIGVGLAWVPVGGILSAIAIPNFIRYEAKAKQSEAKANLKGLYTGIQAAKLETGAYTDDFEVIGFSPEAGTRYSYYFGSSTVEATRGEVAPLPPELATGVFADDFIAAAVGNIDSDPTLDVWVIDASGDLQNHTDDVHE